MKEKLAFKPRARLLLQLGDELIRNEGIALLELIKNSYDADATKVKVSMQKVHDKDDGIIVIEDNGEGMDFNLIKTVWMEPGSNNKLLEANDKRRTKRFQRFVLGEKGIGRFAVHKLGDSIEIITKQKNKNEVRILIDWRKFEKANYLNETPIDVEQREPEYFSKNEHGTKIIIKKLRKNWTRGMIREVYRSWNALRSPFSTPESFDIEFDIDNKDWIKGIITPDEIFEFALFHFKCVLEGDMIKQFHYEFRPYKSMKKLKPRKITEKDERVKQLLKMIDNDDQPINLFEHEIGTVKFEGYIFDRDPTVLSLGVSDKQGFRDYLNANGGVKVYKDGIRVYDYGEPGSDWLNLDIRRVNVPAQRISNNIIIAAVSLERGSSRALVEKTNREGFIENEAYLKFISSVLYTLHVVELQRLVDKNLLRTFYGPTQKSEPVVSKLNQLKVTVKEKIQDEKLQKTIVEDLEKIEKDYEEISERLLRSAGAGLNLSAVVHEVEKIVNEIEKILATDTSSRAYVLVKHLSELINGFTVLIRKSGTRTHKIKNIVDQSLFVSEYRFKAHKISVVKDENALSKDLTITCAENLIISSVLNILDNSIWWEEYAKVKNKKIFVSCSDDLPGYNAIILADNGPGFAVPTEEITKPFVTAKPNGMGLGLHIVQQIMEAHGGDVIFPQYSDFDIPSEFKKGAIVALIFKK